MEDLACRRVRDAVGGDERVVCVADQPLPPAALCQLALAIPNMLLLGRLDVSNCGIDDAAAARLVDGLASLPRFAAAAEPEAELLLCNNALSDAALGTSELAGVAYLSLAGCARVTDAGMRAAAVCFPGASSLMAMRTAVEGEGLAALLSALPRLRLLGLDGCALGDAAARALSARRARSNLEVWVRSFTYTAAWASLFEKAARPETAASLALKHDLLDSNPKSAPNAIAVHAELRVRLFVNFVGTFEVSHRGVRASRTLVSVAADCINELNAVARGDERARAQRERARRSDEYRSVFEPAFAAGKLDRQFTAGVMYLSTQAHAHKFTELLGSEREQLFFNVEAA